MSAGGARPTTAAAAMPIPPAARKIVQGLKEIVNCPESEIYAMLKECGMDPDEAVNRLLTQDTFHEVKSKREKKKEVKETPESRPRATNNSSARGYRVGVDRGGRTTSTQYSPSDYGSSRAKPATKRENGTNSVPASSISGPSMTGNNLPQNQAILSESAFPEITTHAIAPDDGTSSSSHPSSGYQNSWVAKPGHVSMADIVKKGRPQGKTSSIPYMPGDMPYISQNGVMQSMSQHTASLSANTVQASETDAEFYSSQGPLTEDTDYGYEPGTAVEHDPHNDWSLVEESTGISGSAVHETFNAYANYADPSTSPTLHADEVDVEPNSLDEIEVLERNITEQSRPIDSTFENENPEDDFVEYDDPTQTGVSYQPQSHEFEHEEDENADLDVSSAASNFQQLRLHNERQGATSAVDNPAVIIPSHLQVTNADCSHLSFGSFSSGISATFPGSYQSPPQQTNFEMAPVVEDIASIDQSDARKDEYYDNDQLHYTSSDNVDSETVANTRNYDTPQVSEPESTRNDTSDAASALQYNLPSAPGYAFSNTTQENTGPYAYPQANQQIHNLAPFASLMQPYGNALPSSLLAPGVQPLREFDHPFTPLLSTQSMPTKYSTPLSTVTGSAGSTPEVNPGAFSTLQQASPTLPSTSMTAGPGLPQHLPMHPYSQPTLPLGHFANMVSYPFLPQSYYLPSAAFQQQYTSSGPFHQSPAALQSAGMKYTLPQYKNNLSMSSLPQAAAGASGYGGFGASANLPGGFSLNASTVAASAPMGFDESLSMQYKEGNQYAPHQQTENSMWAQGAASRTMSAIPSSSFYSFQGQTLPNGYRQGQQPSQFGAMGYMNPYHSQAGASQEVHQSQSQSEGNLNGSQQSQQSHQLWQHGY